MANISITLNKRTLEKLKTYSNRSRVIQEALEWFFTSEASEHLTGESIKNDMNKIRTMSQNANLSKLDQNTIKKAKEYGRK